MVHYLGRCVRRVFTLHGLSPCETTTCIQRSYYDWRSSLGTRWALVLGFLAGIHLTSGTTVSFAKETQLAKQVDHIIIRADDPQRLFSESRYRVRLVGSSLGLEVAKGYGKSNN
jgi:hypothetical protein